MVTPHAATPDNGPEGPSIHALVEQLQAPLSWKDKRLSIAYLSAILYAVVAADQGRPFLVQFLGTMVVVFLLHDATERRVRRRVDVLVRIVRELERKAA
jgi:hypothetical protein